MRNRLGRMEAFDALLEELTATMLASRAAAPSTSDLHPAVRYAGARMTRGLGGEVRRPTQTTDRASLPTVPSPPRGTGRESVRDTYLGN